MERPRSIRELPRVGRWDGNVKLLTQECTECPYFTKYSDGKVCSGGEAWKVLNESKIRKTCQLKKDKENESNLSDKSDKIVIIPTWLELVTGTPDFKKMGFHTVLVRDENDQK